MWWDALGFALLLFAVSALDRWWLRRFLASLLHVVYHKYASIRHQHTYNAWSAKSGMLHNHAQLTHVNPYKSFTNLPLAFLVF
jgi:hypothetical protein